VAPPSSRLASVESRAATSLRNLEREIADKHRLAVEQRLNSDRATRQRQVQARRRRRARIRRNRTIAVAGVVVLAAIVWSVFPGRSSPAGASRHLRPVFVPHGRSGSFVVPGALGALPWPSGGQAAVAVANAGVMASSPGQHIAPIASLTKMMTAYVVLRDHALAPGTEGPQFTMTAADVRAWVAASSSGFSNVPVALGEHLTEHQLLEALLLPSADNIADYLAVWDAGSIPKFVGKMNAAARALGLRSTHYADASGINPGSRSDATDQARLAALLIGDPVVRSIVSHPSLRFQVAGTIRNYNPALGVDGIIGVKSGFTSAAHGCLATAAWERVAGHSVLLVSVALGQVDGLYGAARVDEKLTVAGAAKLVGSRPARSGSTVGAVSIGGGSAVPVVISGPDPIFVGWPGLKVKSSLSLLPLVASGAQPATPSAQLGTVIWSTTSGTVATAPFSSVATAPTSSTS
jgi:D-alanyl-D-alanine carboxypeptidase (penicillin-binding protein 5/6)